LEWYPIRCGNENIDYRLELNSDNRRGKVSNKYQISLHFKE